LNKPEWNKKKEEKKKQMLKEFLKKADFNSLNKKDFKKNFEYKNNCNLRK
jgi:hypothetical protein